MNDLVQELKLHLQEHPNATVREYYEYLKEERKRQKEEERTRQENENVWYDEQIGKYFFVNFNSSSYHLFQLSRKTHDEYFADVYYSIYTYDSNSSLQIEKDVYINKIWLDNPYSEKYRSYKKCKEVSKEEWDNYMSVFHEYEQTHEKLKKMVKNI